MLLSSAIELAMVAWMNSLLLFWSLSEQHFIIRIPLATMMILLVGAKGHQTNHRQKMNRGQNLLS
jgi:hypothetical protein